MNSFSLSLYPPNFVAAIRSVLDVFQIYRGPIERGTFIPLRKKIREYAKALSKYDDELVNLAIDWLIHGGYLSTGPVPPELVHFRDIFRGAWSIFEVVLQPTDKLWKLAEVWPRDIGPTPTNELWKLDEGPPSVEKPPALEGQAASSENQLTLEEVIKDLSETERALFGLAVKAFQGKGRQELMKCKAESVYEKIQNLPAEEWPAQLENFKLPSLSTFRTYWSRIRKKLGCLQRRRHLPPPDCRSAIRWEDIDQRSDDWE